jgi:hypothetical protein
MTPRQDQNRAGRLGNSALERRVLSALSGDCRLWPGQIFLAFSVNRSISGDTMRRLILLLATLLFTVSISHVHAQFGGGMGSSPTGPSLSGELLKLFGDHTAFSANLEFEVRQNEVGNPVTLPGKISFSDGKTRFEMDLTQAKGDQIPPEAIIQLKQMGMDKMVVISLPSQDQSLLVYPGLKSYVKMPINDPDADKTVDDFDIQITELGREERGGYKCTKNRVVVTDKAGGSQESTVWNANELDGFPVRIETTEEGHGVVLLFKDVKLATPASSQFTPPADYTPYDNVMGMMQEIMVKRMGGGTGTAPQK